MINMTCPRIGEKCNEYMCGSSVDGICTDVCLASYLEQKKEDNNDKDRED